jgi:hypothetical protein
LSRNKLTPAERSLLSQLANGVRWSKEPDRTAATAPARAALETKFEDEVDPERELTPEERAKRVDAARRAYYARLGLASAKARRKAAS